ncbi:uncharacterized protein LOC141764982 [Sebastes fasciatus]|uniref:uncharacterized protein LOC141764982 n=1 Tax=Sebastes fasciatus TaxID=394691 RepID=UPI003D9DED9D
MSAESNFTLTIKDLTESDENNYCCGSITENPGSCCDNRTELHVADLQVKVIPTTEGQTATLICSTSCPLTENPAVYIWYKNREFLYQDWSPWYQQLVSSEEAVTYSCAIKGYEDLRAPQVSVDSVSPTFFNVTYAKGRMCSSQHTSEDEPCSITYPTEVHVQLTPENNAVTLTCNTSYPMTDPHTAYRWYWNRELYSDCESQHMTVLNPCSTTLSCAVKGHEDLRSDEVCLDKSTCWRVNYVSRRICALEGSSVNISSEYSHPHNHKPKLWYKIKRSGEEEAAEALIKNASRRVEYDDNMTDCHILRIHNLTKNDSAEYTFTLQERDDEGWKQSDIPGVTLAVTGLEVQFSPSAVVKEYQRVTLTCSTSCPLTDNTTFIWFFNSRPLTLTENQNKHLVLYPVTSQNAGNYSCAVKSHNNSSSDEETLTVQGLTSIAILNAMKLTLLFLILLALLLLYLKKRKKRPLTSAAELSDKVQTGQMDQLYESFPLTTTNPAAKREAAEQQEDIM